MCILALNGVARRNEHVWLVNAVRCFIASYKRWDIILFSAMHCLFSTG